MTALGLDRHLKLCPLVLMEAMHNDALGEVKRWMAEATAAAKCWPCGCLHNTLTTLEAASRDLPADAQPLREIIRAARGKLLPVVYECLGCATCYPALAANAFAQAFPDRATTLTGCATDIPEGRAGWPPLPGDYRVLRYQAPIAICTLTDEALVGRLGEAGPAGVSLIGRLHTENLGIERIIQNTLANPSVRFLVLCGADSTQRIGHLPGQSLLALLENGLDERGRILGAKGKRPVIRNLPQEAVEAFRKQVEVRDLIGSEDPTEILATAADCAARDPGPAEPFASFPQVSRTLAHPPERLALDPAGYFLIFPDRGHGTLVVEHYQNGGFLDRILEGRIASDVYATAIGLGLLTRLDHAAYLGKELALAERALRTGETYVQDAAPAPAGETRSATPCDCSSTCSSGPRQD